MYSSACFGRFLAYHQELITALTAYDFTLKRGGSSVVGRGQADHDQQHCYHHAPTVKPVAATAVIKLLMMGVRTPETC